jgi:hypothetical protein
MLLRVKIRQKIESVKDSIELAFAITRIVAKVTFILIWTSIDYALFYRKRRKRMREWLNRIRAGIIDEDN